MNDRQPGPLGAGEATPWVISGTVVGGFTLYGCAWFGGTLFTLLTGGGWRPAPFSLTAMRTLTLHGPGALWPDRPIPATLGVLLGVGGAAALLTVVIRKVNRYRAHPEGLARPRHVRPLAAKAMTARARALRPSLPRTGPLAPEELGPPIGALDGHKKMTLTGSWEDVRVSIMGPRTGKTSGLAVPTILAAPGAVLVTSNKSDLLEITRRARGRIKGARVWVFDPQQIAHVRREFWWDMLATAVTVPGAERLARAFVAAAADENARRDFWFGAAGNVLRSYFHAAACTGHTVIDVLTWLANPVDRTPVDALRKIGMTPLAEQIQGTVRGALETRDGIYETARQVVACLLDPEVTAWVTPQRGLPRFDPAAFPHSRDTLYLLSKNGGGSAAGLIAAATDTVLQSGIAAAERAGGRLDPPMSPVLDEAANVCRIEDLPQAYSYLGSLGIPIDTILQSYRQGVMAWGEAGMDTMWSAATLKMVGAGLDDADFAGKLSKLIGEYPIWRHSVSFGGSSGHSNSIQPHDRPSLQVAEIRTLSKGSALLLATGIPVARVALAPWYTGPRAAELAEDAKAEAAELKLRAQAALGRRRAVFSGALQ